MCMLSLPRPGRQGRRPPGEAGPDPAGGPRNDNDNNNDNNNNNNDNDNDNDIIIDTNNNDNDIL